MPIRIGIIGVQHFHVFGIVSHLQALPGVQVVGVAEINDELQRDAADRYGVAGFAGYRQLLEAVRPDAVVVATINNEKAATIAGCIRAGVHVLADKPIATEITQLTDIEQALRDHPVRLGMLVWGGYGSDSHALRRLVRDELGRVIQLNFLATHRWWIDPIRGTRFPWNYVRKTFGGAIVVDGIHSMNQLRWLAEREVIAVTATHSNGTMAEHPEFEDNFSILAELDGGGSGTLSYSWLTPGGEPSHGRATMTIVGTQGMLEVRSAVESEAPRLEEGVVPSAREEYILTTGTEAPHEIFLPAVAAPSVEEDFIAGVRDSDYQPVLSPSWHIQSSRLTLLARQSADEHRRLAASH